MSNPLSATPRIHVVGRRNSGKTTLVCDLVRELTGRGLRVATIKHTHHNHELDTPGKDSWKHREAGAVGVGILSPHMLAAFVPGERSSETEPDYRQLTDMFAGADLLLVEGDLHAAGIKVEVWREEAGEPPYAREKPEIRAVISDAPVEVAVAVWPRAEVRQLADRVLGLVGLS